MHWTEEVEINNELPFNVNGLDFKYLKNAGLPCSQCHLRGAERCYEAKCTSGIYKLHFKGGTKLEYLLPKVEPKYSGLDLNIELARAILGWVNSGEVDVSRFASVLIARYSLSLSISSDPKSRDLSPMDLVERILSATQSGSNLTEIIRWVDHYIFVENHPLVEDAEEVAVKYLLKKKHYLRRINEGAIV